MPKSQGQLLSLVEMAQRLGVRQAWLADEAAVGRVPCLMAGRRHLFNPDAVERVLAERAAQQAQEQPT